MRNLGNLIAGLGGYLEDAGSSLSKLGDTLVGIGCRLRWKGDTHPAYSSTATSAKVRMR